jgi:hypothetical protein
MSKDLLKRLTIATVGIWLNKLVLYLEELANRKKNNADLAKLLM